MQPLSVVIITYNEEHNIARCIASAKKVADEIIVLDSFSTDQTVAIARMHGATVFQEKFRGYIGQKNYAVQFASNNYILSLDADEELDERLTASILQAKKTFSSRAYRMNRCTSFCGKFIRHGLWYPDRKIRLFDRRIARWGGINPHDKIILDNGYKFEQLKGDLLHYSFNTVDDLIWQNNRLSSIAASSLFAIDRKSNWYRMLVHPAWAFFNGFILRLGFLDGFEGFTIAINTAHQTFLKYSKLYKIQRTRLKKSAPLTRPLVPESKYIAGEG
jgi:glycosyltransferase involved in cell wall biosynthesis